MAADCPFCKLVSGKLDESVYSTQDDIVYEDDNVVAFICCIQWEETAGHCLVIPRVHFEQEKDLPDDIVLAIHNASVLVGKGMLKVYGANSYFNRQNNGAPSQDVFHYHKHVLPCYGNSFQEIQRSKYSMMNAVERKQYADKLKAAL